MVRDFDGSIGSWDLNRVRNKGTSFASCAFACEGSWLVVKLECTLKYTWEISENSLAFLDIKLSINDNGLSTSVHYKPTDSHKCHLLHNLYAMQENLHRQNREETGRPLPRTPTPTPTPIRKEQEREFCHNCGKQRPRGKCPAYGTSCRKCGKANHWQSVCRSSKRKQFNQGARPVFKRSIHAIVDRATMTRMKFRQSVPYRLTLWKTCGTRDMTCPKKPL